MPIANISDWTSSGCIHIKATAAALSMCNFDANCGSADICGSIHALEGFCFWKNADARMDASCYSSKSERESVFEKKADAWLDASFPFSKSERESVFEKSGKARLDAGQVVPGATGVFKSTGSNEDLLQSHFEKNESDTKQILLRLRGVQCKLCQGQKKKT